MNFNNPYWFLVTVPLIVVAMGLIVLINPDLSQTVLKYVAVAAIGLAIPAFGFLFAVAAHGIDASTALPKLHFILLLTAGGYLLVAIMPWTIKVMVWVAACMYQRVKMMTANRTYLPVVDNGTDTTSVYAGLCH